MARYEYQCLNCKIQFEVTQKMSDDPLTECERCGGELEKLISRSCFQVNGEGAYDGRFKG